jgi:hypothetical protein
VFELRLYLMAESILIIPFWSTYYVLCEIFWMKFSIEYSVLIHLLCRYYIFITYNFGFRRQKVPQFNITWQELVNLILFTCILKDAKTISEMLIAHYIGIQQIFRILFLNDYIVTALKYIYIHIRSSLCRIAEMHSW